MFKVRPERLSRAVAQFARKFGYHRVCYVAVDVFGATVVHAEPHFRTAKEARHYALRHFSNGYWYGLFQKRDEPHPAIFPSSTDVLHFLAAGEFLIAAGNKAPSADLDALLPENSRPYQILLNHDVKHSWKESVPGGQIRPL